MARTLLFSGFDLHAPEIPADARVLLPPIALPELDDFRGVVERAIEEPVDGEPLDRLIRPTSRVAVVVDDPSLPVPPPSQDCRREMLEAVLEMLDNQGVRPSRASVLIANGLSRQWRDSELAELFSPTDYPIRCHDAEAGANLVRLGEEPEGPVEVNRALAEADLVVYPNVVTLPMRAGTFGLAHGTCGYRTARFLGAPQLFADETRSPFEPGSPYARIHERVAAQIGRKVPIFQVSAVLNNELWSPAFSALLRSDAGLSRPLQMWNALPNAVRHRAARLLKASYRPIAVFAGSPAEVAEEALQAYYRQHEVSTDGDAQVVVFGLPDQGPASVHSAQNPVLAASLALGYLSNLFSGKPLLRKGGVLIFANPLAPEFDRRVHLPHHEFYETVLRNEREPEAIHERYEPYFSGRPEFVASYQRRYAFHGSHPLQSWNLCTPARRRAGRIVVARGDPRACSRLGFTPAADVEDALDKAREFLGERHPSVTVMEIPPPFWVRVRL